MPLGSGQMGCKLLIAAAEGLSKPEESAMSLCSSGLSGPG